MCKDYRLKKLSSYAFGRVLDIGFAAQPNPYLQGEIYGFDMQAAPLPPNYEGVIVGDATDLAGLSERFDTVVAGQLLEHLDNPVRFLKDCYDILNPGGRVVLSTPNPYFPPVIWLERLLSRRFFYTDEHVFMFSPTYLARLLERQGFRNIRVLSGGVPIGPMLVPYLSRVLKQPKPLLTKRDLLRIELPFPRAFCYAILYTGEKT
jgi:SAM-dependent methyltransferase